MKISKQEKLVCIAFTMGLLLGLGLAFLMTGYGAVGCILLLLWVVVFAFVQNALPEKTPKHTE